MGRRWFGNAGVAIVVLAIIGAVIGCEDDESRAKRAAERERAEAAERARIDREVACIEIAETVISKYNFRQAGWFVRTGLELNVQNSCAEGAPGTVFDIKNWPKTKSLWDKCKRVSEVLVREIPPPHGKEDAEYERLNARCLRLEGIGPNTRRELLLGKKYRQ